MTVAEIMQEFGVSRQTVILPIHSGRLKARKRFWNKKTHMWVINKSDFENYRKGRYKQEKMIDGKPIFDKDKGLYSVNEAAEIIGCNPHRVYYHVRIGVIPAKRVRSSWVLSIKDINEYKSKLVRSRKKSRMQYKPMRPCLANSA